ncbi:MAG: hypothetical protein ACLRMN_11705 [Mediterraneibacter gnavus]
MEIAFQMTKEETASYTDARAEVCLWDEGKLIAKKDFQCPNSLQGLLKLQNPSYYGVVRILNCIRWKSVFLTDRGN